MQITRRVALAGLAASSLTACGGAPQGPVPQTAYRTVPNAGYDAWVASFRPRAAASGISAVVLDRAFRGAGYIPDVVERDRNQTEFTRTLEDYLAIAASDERIRLGRAKLKAHAATLAAIEARHGVEAKVVAAIWGLESRYGERRGDVPIVSALSTLAYDGRRGEFFEKQLIAALQILQQGDTTPERLTGSWAGAMGHTQFIPTSYQAYAVDFTGDGRRDIWSDDPSDALASTAAYLSRSGWRRGQLWGTEARVPAGVGGGARSAAGWAGLGVTRGDGRPLPDHGTGRLIWPGGTSGPAFIVFHNFNVILRYNNAEKYGIGVGHLSDRLAGGGPIRASFGPDAYGLTLDDRKALQRALTAKGFDTGEPDGVLGAKTESAIRAYQAANGLAVTGAPSVELLRRLT